jgi:general stress protein YciG
VGRVVTFSLLAEGACLLKAFVYIYGDNIMAMTPQQAGGEARAKALSSERKENIAGEGGDARASSLTPERRHEIAVEGGKASHGSRFTKK